MHINCTHFGPLLQEEMRAAPCLPLANGLKALKILLFERKKAGKIPIIVGWGLVFLEIFWYNIRSKKDNCALFAYFHVVR